MKEIKELNKWRHNPWSWIGRFNIVKIPVFSNWIYRVNAIPIKILASYFVDIDKMILKFKRKDKRPRIANIILEGQSQSINTTQLQDLL